MILLMLRTWGNRQAHFDILTVFAVSSDLLEANFRCTIRSLFCLFLQTLIIHYTLSLGSPSADSFSTMGLCGEAFKKAGCLLPSSGYQPSLQGRESRGLQSTHRGTLAQFFCLRERQGRKYKPNRLSLQKIKFIKHLKQYVSGSYSLINTNLLT